jgi:hypothetical protein
MPGSWSLASVAGPSIPLGVRPIAASEWSWCRKGSRAHASCTEQGSFPTRPPPSARCHPRFSAHSPIASGLIASAGLRSAWPNTQRQEPGFDFAGLGQHCNRGLPLSSQSVLRDHQGRQIPERTGCSFERVPTGERPRLQCECRAPVHSQSLGQYRFRCVSLRRYQILWKDKGRQLHGRGRCTPGRSSSGQWPDLRVGVGVVPTRQFECSLTTAYACAGYRRPAAYAASLIPSSKHLPDHEPP